MRRREVLINTRFTFEKGSSYPLGGEGQRGSGFRQLPNITGGQIASFSFLVLRPDQDENEERLRE